MKIAIALISLSLICPLLAAAAPVSEQSKVIYRYKNDKGVTVLDSAIPPEYVSDGYEIMSLGGKVLKVVPPALSGDEAERARILRIAREERAKADLELRRNYSNANDIDAAKQRNLKSIKGNLDILEINLTSLRSKLQDAQSRAAAMERGGRTLTPEILANIATLEQEQVNIQEQIKQRQHEYQQVSDKFDADRQRFIEITKPAP